MILMYRKKLEEKGKVDPYELACLHFVLIDIDGEDLMRVK